MLRTVGFLALTIWMTVAVVVLVPPPAAAQGCGDGVVDPSEQCDDGDRGRLDGCDPACRYEQVQGLTALALSGATGPAFCTPATNQLGRAVSAIGLNALNSALADGLASGALDQTLVVGELDDPLGHDDPALELGAVAASADPANPVSGLDSWHLGDPSHLAPDLAPLSVLPGSLSASSNPCCALVPRTRPKGAYTARQTGTPSAPVASTGAPR